MADACKAIPSSFNDVTCALDCSSAVELSELITAVRALLVSLMAVLVVGRIAAVLVFLDCKGTGNIQCIQCKGTFLLVLGL